MLSNAFARVGFSLMAGLLVTVGACRSSTDRIRVLEAEKADAHRRNQDLRQDQAELKAKLLEEQSRAEGFEARSKALEAQLELSRERGETVSSDGGRPVGIDAGGLRDELDGSGVDVYADRDGGATMVLASDITFRPGRADLNSSAQRVLQNVAQALKRQGAVIRQVRIEGHTDSDPIRKSGWASNEELSQARADKVRMFLAAQGIDEGLMTTIGYGASVPIEPNETKAGKAKNRRVEIKLVAAR